MPNKNSNSNMAMNYNIETLTALVSTLTEQIRVLVEKVVALEEKNEKLTQKSTKIVNSQWKAYHQITDLEKIICGTPDDREGGLTMMVLNNSAAIEKINEKIDDYESEIDDDDYESEIDDDDYESESESEIDDDDAEELEQQAHEIVKDMDPEMYKDWTTSDLSVKELEQQAHEIVKDMDPEMYKDWTSKEVNFEDFKFIENIIKKKLNDLEAGEDKNTKLSIWEDFLKFINTEECKQYITHHPPFQKALQNKMVEIYNYEKNAATYRCYRSIFGERIHIN